MTRTSSRVRFGMMNHPARDPVAEILVAKRMGFDFIDLTLEPPAAGPETYNHAAVKKALARTGLGVVGHTGWHLPGNAAYPEVRRGTTESLVWAARYFSDLGAETMTYHIQGAVAGYIGLAPAIDSQVEVLTAAAAACKPLGVQIVCEHITAWPQQFAILDALFQRVPSLGFHLDVGHANLAGGEPNKTGEFVRRYGRRLKHVHLSDNRGGHDEHMPLGAGRIDWPREIGHLKKLGYNRTVTLEVFSDDPDYLALSLKKARAWFSARGR